MKITGLVVLKCNPEGTDPVILANATDVNRFFFFDSRPVRELIVFFSRTIAKHTPPGHHRTVQREEYKVHSYSRNGLCAVGFMDDHYPAQSALSVLNQKATSLLDWQWWNQDFVVLDEYEKNFGDSWRTVQADSAQPWPYLNQALTKFQDPAEVDKLSKIQGELDLTTDMINDAIKKVLERGEKLNSLMEKSSDLSAASREFYNRAQQTNQCCTIL